MAIRILVYLGLLYQDLIRMLGLQRGDPLPTVLPWVVYNGFARWRSPVDVAELIQTPPPGLESYLPSLRYLLLDQGAIEPERLRAMRNPVASLFRLEHCSPEEAPRAVRSLVESLIGPEHRELRRDFTTWLLSYYLPRRLPGVEVPTLKNLEEVEHMLEQKAPTWTEIWEQRGVEKGMRRGRQEGERKGLRKGMRKGESALLLRQIERRFGPPDDVLRRRIERAGSDQLLLWGERILDARTLDDVFNG